MTRTLKMFHCQMFKKVDSLKNLWPVIRLLDWKLDCYITLKLFKNVLKTDNNIKPAFNPS